MWEKGFYDGVDLKSVSLLLWVREFDSHQKSIFESLYRVYRYDNDSDIVHDIIAVLSLYVLKLYSNY
jgi:hypothetical protein